MKNKLTFFQEVFCNEEDKQHILNNMASKNQHVLSDFSMEENGDGLLSNTDVLGAMELETGLGNNDQRQPMKSTDSFDELFDMITSDEPSDTNFDDEEKNENNEVEVVANVATEDNKPKVNEDKEDFEMPLI